jgi:hypothetical protein
MYASERRVRMENWIAIQDGHEDAQQIGFRLTSPVLLSLRYSKLGKI